MESTHIFGIFYTGFEGWILWDGSKHGKISYTELNRVHSRLERILQSNYKKHYNKINMLDIVGP